MAFFPCRVFALVARFLLSGTLFWVPRASSLTLQSSLRQYRILSAHNHTLKSVTLSPLSASYPPPSPHLSVAYITLYTCVCVRDCLCIYNFVTINKFYIWNYLIIFISLLEYKKAGMLFCSLLYLLHLEQCLTYNLCLANIYWIHERLNNIEIFPELTLLLGKIFLRTTKLITHN